MIIYQVKVVVQAEIEDQWLHWMKREHVPDLLATGLVLSSQVWKSMDEPHGYYFNYQFRNIEDYQQYLHDHAPQLKSHSLKLFGDKFRATRQLFEMV